MFMKINEILTETDLRKVSEDQLNTIIAKFRSTDSLWIVDDQQNVGFYVISDLTKSYGVYNEDLQSDKFYQLMVNTFGQETADYFHDDPGFPFEPISSEEALKRSFDNISSDNGTASVRVTLWNTFAQQYDRSL